MNEKAVNETAKGETVKAAKGETFGDAVPTPVNV